MKRRAMMGRNGRIRTEPGETIDEGKSGEGEDGWKGKLVGKIRVGACEEVGREEGFGTGRGGRLGVGC